MALKNCTVRIARALMEERLTVASLRSLIGIPMVLVMMDSLVAVQWIECSGGRDIGHGAKVDRFQCGGSEALEEKARQAG